MILTFYKKQCVKISVPVGTEWWLLYCLAHASYSLADDNPYPNIEALLNAMEKKAFDPEPIIEQYGQNEFWQYKNSNAAGLIRNLWTKASQIKPGIVQMYTYKFIRIRGEENLSKVLCLTRELFYGSKGQAELSGQNFNRDLSPEALVEITAVKVG